MLRIAIGSDHGGFDQKEVVVKYLREKGYEVTDVGTNSHDSCHYPLFGEAVARLVADHKCDFGVVICTSGEGICIAANKVKGIRCGIGYNDDVARLMRQHNDANVIAFGAKFMSDEDVKRRIDIFLSTEFEGGRHQTRVDLIKDIENK
jgi:ribose 5-phosphate isomerase B